MSKIRVAINGFGRIGRSAFKIALANKKLEIVAINDLTDAKTLAHLLKYDSVYGTYERAVSRKKAGLAVENKTIPVFAEKDPTKLPWRDLRVDVVVESTGFFTTYESAAQHLKAGARKVIISAVSKGETRVPTYVLGANHQLYKKRERIIAMGSCTTNCTAPVAKVLSDNFGIVKGFVTTIHAVTVTQKLHDAPDKSLRNARAAFLNIIPHTTGAAEAVVLVVPSLKGKLDGLAFRVPIITGSVIDLNVMLRKKVTADQVNAVFKKSAQTSMKGIIQYSEEELVSTDIVGRPYSAIFDSKLTRVLADNFVKVVAWYDNEMGYADRLVKMIELVVK